MKVLEHGKYYHKTPPIICRCECGCSMEIGAGDIEGGICSAPFVWCPECRELVHLPPIQAPAVRGINVMELV